MKVLLQLDQLLFGLTQVSAPLGKLLLRWDDLFSAACKSHNALSTAHLSEFPAQVEHDFDESGLKVMHSILWQ